eukprot:3169394-Lingulodinium_polyedra.AAC.1
MDAVPRSRAANAHGARVFQQARGSVRVCLLRPGPPGAAAPRLTRGLLPRRGGGQPEQPGLPDGGHL